MSFLHTSTQESRQMPSRASNTLPERHYMLFYDFRDYAMFLCCLFSLYCRVKQFHRRKGSLQRRFSHVMAAVQRQKDTYRKAARALTTQTQRCPSDSGDHVSQGRSLDVDRSERASDNSAAAAIAHFYADDLHNVVSKAALPFARREAAPDIDNDSLFCSFTFPDTHRGVHSGETSLTRAGDGVIAAGSRNCAMGKALWQIEDDAYEAGGEGDDTAAAVRVLADTGAKDALVLLWEVPLERRVDICVNWLSVISNCLTYFLRPSQVLCTFLFCSADLFLHVMSSLNKLHRTERLNHALLKTHRWRSRLRQRLSERTGVNHSASPRHVTKAKPQEADLGLPNLFEQQQQRRQAAVGAVGRVSRALCWACTPLRTAATQSLRVVVAITDVVVLVVMEAIGFVVDVVQRLLPASDAAGGAGSAAAADRSHRRRKKGGGVIAPRAVSEKEGVAKRQRAAGQSNAESEGDVDFSPDTEPEHSEGEAVDDSDNASTSSSSSLPSTADCASDGAGVAARTATTPSDAASVYIATAERWMEGPWALVGLNFLLTTVLLVCHATHLLFPLGALAGYLACCGELLLLGQEAARAIRRRPGRWCFAGCPVPPRCCRRHGAVGAKAPPALHRLWTRLRGRPTAGKKTAVSSRTAGPTADAEERGTAASVADGEVVAVAVDAAATAAREREAAAATARCLSLHVLEHLFTSGFAFFYLLMLFEEGEALWSTHVELMRWYIATVALGVKELLLCLSPPTSAPTSGKGAVAFTETDGDGPLRNGGADVLVE